MSPFVPTTHQQAIADAVRNSEKNLAINAGAGTGKTSTLLWLIESALPQTSKILMCVFNTRNKDEIAGKLKKRGITNASAKTFNGMAYSAFLKRYSIKDTNRDMDMDTSKYTRLIRWWVSNHFPQNSRTNDQLNDIREWLKGALHLVMVNTTRDHQNGDLVLFTGGSLRDSAAIPHALDAESIMSVLERYQLPDLDHVEDYTTCLTGVADLLRMGKLCIENPRAAAAQLGLDAKERPINQSVVDGKAWVDFADQVYWCVVDSWNVWQNPIVLVDEAQDLSPLQRALVNMHVYRRGRVIMVGDPQQAINAWNGADNDGFANSLTFWYVPKANTLDLPVCFRCFKEVCQLAADWKPGFIAATDAISGEIATINPADVVKMVKEGDALIGRTRASCVQWYRELVKQGLPVRLHGINPAEQITRTLEIVSNRAGFDYANLRDCIRDYRDDKVARMTARNKPEAEIENFQDDIDSVTEYLDTIDMPRTYEALIEKVQVDFAPRTADGGIFIMTGHGSKGGEWNKVFNITPERFPTIRQTSSPADIVQEKNLRYVVQTRAMQAYYLVVKDAPSYFQPVKPAAPSVVVTPLPAPIALSLPVPQPIAPAPALPAPAVVKPSLFTPEFLASLPVASSKAVQPLDKTVIHAKLHTASGLVWLVEEYDPHYREFWCLAYDPKHADAAEWVYVSLDDLDNLGNVQMDTTWTPRPFYEAVAQECPLSCFADAIKATEQPTPSATSPAAKSFPTVRPIAQGIASATPSAALTASRIETIITSLYGLSPDDLEYVQAAIAMRRQQAQKVSA